jgi:hypothetical protein
MFSNGRLNGRKGRFLGMIPFSRFAKEWFRQDIGQESDILQVTPKLNVAPEARVVQVQPLTGYHLGGLIT